MTITEAIEKSVEGGWNSEECAPPVGSRDRFDYHGMILDPLFWQCFGKGLGNKDVMECDSNKCDDKLCKYAGYKDPKEMFDSCMSFVWFGDGIEDYFKTLN